MLNRQILGVTLAMGLVAGTLGILANLTAHAGSSSISTDPYLTAVLTVRKAGSDQQ